MERELKVIIISGVFLLGLVIGVIGGHLRAKAAWEAKAVGAGVATWDIVDQDNNPKVEFRWITE